MTEEEFWAALAPIPTPAPVFYRLYYDEQGLPLFYSMENLLGNYIEISQELYITAPTHVKVTDGKLKILKVNPIAKLVPSTEGTACAINDVSIIVDEKYPHTKWSVKQYDPN
jgi:hypothetical protein